jgi:transposase-like protein
MWAIANILRIGSYCPHCYSTDIHRSHRRNVTEQLLSALFLFPYRCQACQSRFYLLSMRRTDRKRQGSSQ